ncbi:MAG: primosomal protein N' [gamma proteobacterium symbiont of Phacoides pectinatus]
MSQRLILQVAVPAPLHTLFDYLPPDGEPEARLRPGVRVMVPFGRGGRCAVVMGLARHSGQPSSRLKAARRVLDEAPLFATGDLALLEWAAAYYQHPIGEVVANALPVRLRKGEPVADSGHRGWRLSGSGRQEEPARLRRAPRQAQVLRLLAEAPDGLTREQIYVRCGACRAVLRNLLEKGWIEACEVPPEASLPAPGGRPAPTLNAHQVAAVEGVARGLGGFAVSLLEGVTGSGKTEVYLALIEHALARGCQTLVLVPEIGLTPQLMLRFQRRIAAPLALLHSGLSDRERERAWHAARSGRARVVVGTRSALFTPLPRLGLILVDEEHDLSFKQQEGFRYSARDLAVIRAQRSGCPVLLGSATPSLESLNNALRGRYHHLRLPERAGGAHAPRLDLLDIRSARLDGGLSPVMLRLTGEQLQAGNQVLLFLNRRGYAPVLTCYDCGWVAECGRCDARMTLHLQSRLLWCHHCGSQRRLERRCPECGGGEVHPMGQGTERLAETLGQRFHDVSLVRIDRDATRRKGSLERLLGEIREGRHALLLGTQMLAKGHHFPDVTLVGILDVDQGLFGADFRAAERMAQLITQVAGRAGRAEKPGRVVIQTRHPDHPLLNTLVRQGYDAFARMALTERRETQFPPFSHQALLRAEAHDERLPRRFLELAMALGRELAARDVEFWGPVPAPMERRAGRYRAHLLVQGAERVRLQRLLARWVPRLPGLEGARRVRWSIDVDPQEML